MASECSKNSCFSYLKLFLLWNATFEFISANNFIRNWNETILWIFHLIFSLNFFNSFFSFYFLQLYVFVSSLLPLSFTRFSFHFPSILESEINPGKKWDFMRNPVVVWYENRAVLRYEKKKTDSQFVVGIVWCSLYQKTRINI